jgi:hypothetical protein
MSDTYKPTGKLITKPHHAFLSLTFPDHDGTGEFAQGKVDPTEAGKQGGHTSGSGSSGSASGNSGGSAKGGESSLLLYTREYNG